MTITADEMDISSYVGTVTWSGDVNQMARKLAFDYLYTDLPRKIGQIELTVGSRVLMFDDDGEQLFDGIVVSEEFDEADIKKNIQAADYAFYLKSEVYGEFKGTPRHIVSTVLSAFGISAGQLPETAGEVSILATGDKTIYQVITEAYEAAGEKVYIYMTGMVLNVEVTGTRLAGVVSGDDSVAGAKYKSSMENMINRVAVINADASLITNVDSEDAGYGMIQKVYKHDSRDKDMMAEAVKLFKTLDNSGNISVKGNISYTAGRSIIVEKVNSKIQGLFYITSDSHTFLSGQHTANLTLDFSGVVSR